MSGAGALDARSLNCCGDDGCELDEVVRLRRENHALQSAAFARSRGIGSARELGGYDYDEMVKMFGPYLHEGVTEGLDIREVQLIETVRQLWNDRASADDRIGELEAAVTRLKRERDELTRVLDERNAVVNRIYKERAILRKRLRACSDPTDEHLIQRGQEIHRLQGSITALRTAKETAEAEAARLRERVVGLRAGLEVIRGGVHFPKKLADDTLVDDDNRAAPAPASPACGTCDGMEGIDWSGPIGKPCQPCNDCEPCPACGGDS